MDSIKNIHTFATLSKTESNMVAVVQLVRASDCGSECRGFESHQPPQSLANARLFFIFGYQQPLFDYTIKNGTHMYSVFYCIISIE